MDEAGIELLLRAAAIAEPKTSYDTGHGDFASGRLVNIRGQYPPTIPPGDRENNVRVVELDDFVR